MSRALCRMSGASVCAGMHCANMVVCWFVDSFKSIGVVNMIKKALSGVCRDKKSCRADEHLSVSDRADCSGTCTNCTAVLVRMYMLYHLQEVSVSCVFFLKMI